MDSAHITNECLMKHDWAREEKTALLRNIGRIKRRGHGVERAPSADELVGADPRSVKFQLKGGFSLRVAWWGVFSNIHRLFSRSASLEDAMYSFHRMHHHATIALLTYLDQSRSLRKAILRDGALKAIHDYLAGVNVR